MKCTICDCPFAESVNGVDSTTVVKTFDKTEMSGRDKKPSDGGSKSNLQSEDLAKTISQPSENLLYIDIEDGCKRVVMLVTPVSLCMLLVVLTIRLIPSVYMEGPSFAFLQEDTSSFEKQAVSSVLNGLKVIGVVVVMTMLLVGLYVHRCYKCIYGWLLIGISLLLFRYSMAYILELFIEYNVAVGFISVSFVVWNFAIVGIISIFMRGPLFLQQSYLVLVSALVALNVLKLLPDWTTWVLCGLLVVWDLIAVLCPKGPLNILVKTASERDEGFMPALIYTSAMMWEIGVTMATPKDSTLKDTHSSSVDDVDGVYPGGRKSVMSKRSRNLGEHNRASTTATEFSEAESGIKLGLGDFIFYSLLVGHASRDGDWNTTLTCFLAILMGLVFTLILLTIYQRALPALPISITFGLIFYFLSSTTIQPFLSNLAANQIYI